MSNHLSRRTDGAASGEPCLHEFFRVVTEEDDSHYAELRRKGWRHNSNQNDSPFNFCLNFERSDPQYLSSRQKSMVYYRNLIRADRKSVV